MTASVISLPISADDRRIAAYAAAAVALSVAEAAIPSPVPGIKPGLANIVVLLVLLRHGWRDAAWVLLLRVVAGALALGQLFAPGFFLSLSGALCSLAVLALSIHLPRRWFGPVSHSLLAACAHIGGQLLVARLWLVPNDGVLYLAPVLGGAALVFGLINGLIVAWWLEAETAPGPEAPSALHSLGPASARSGASRIPDADSCSEPPSALHCLGPASARSGASRIPDAVIPAPTSRGIAQ